MHLDINTQMNYWPAEVTGVSETTVPLFSWIRDSLAENGKQTAEVSYGQKGWVGELVSNAWDLQRLTGHLPLRPAPQEACGF